jgi:hypothetical protein
MLHSLDRHVSRTMNGPERGNLSRCCCCWVCLLHLSLANRIPGQVAGGKRKSRLLIRLDEDCFPFVGRCYPLAAPSSIFQLLPSTSATNSSRNSAVPVISNHYSNPALLLCLLMRYIQARLSLSAEVSSQLDITGKRPLVLHQEALAITSAMCIVSCSDLRPSPCLEFPMSKFCTKQSLLGSPLPQLS